MLRFVRILCSITSHFLVFRLYCYWGDVMVDGTRLFVGIVVMFDVFLWCIVIVG